jgi:hypothetical protein
MVWCEFTIAPMMLSLGLLFMTVVAGKSAARRGLFFNLTKLSPCLPLLIETTTPPISQTPGSFKC